MWVCRAFSQRKRDKQIDYAPLMAKDGGKLREHFDARVKQHLTATLRHGSGISELGTTDEVRDYGSTGDAGCQEAPDS